MTKTRATATKRATRKNTIRTSFSLLKEHYDILASVAEQKRVSVAWVVRDAVARYADSW